LNSLGRRRDRASVEPSKRCWYLPTRPLPARRRSQGGSAIGQRARLYWGLLSLANAHALRIAEQPVDQSAIYRRLASEGPGDAVGGCARRAGAHGPTVALRAPRCSRAGSRLEAVAARELARRV
jgi:hypothetical protein